MPAPGLGGGEFQSQSGGGGGDPWQRVPAEGYCAWVIQGRDGGCGTGGDYCWSVGHGSAFGVGTIDILRRPFGGGYAVMGSNLYMGTTCAPGVMVEELYQLDTGVVVAWEQGIVGVVAALAAMARMWRA